MNSNILAIFFQNFPEKENWVKKLFFQIMFFSVLRLLKIRLEMHPRPKAPNLIKQLLSNFQETPKQLPRNSQAMLKKC